MKSWHEVGQLYSNEPGLGALPRKQLLVVGPWPPWFTSPGNVIFRLSNLYETLRDAQEKNFWGILCRLPDLPHGAMELLSLEQIFVAVELIHQTETQEQESIAIAAGRYGSPYCAEMVAIRGFGGGGRHINLADDSFRLQICTATTCNRMKELAVKFGRNVWPSGHQWEELE